jgi:hypothetical protein
MKDIIYYINYWKVVPNFWPQHFDLIDTERYDLQEAESANIYLNRLKLELSRAHTLTVADNPYLRIVLGCAHEQNAHGLQWVVSIGVAIKNTAFVMFQRF